MSNTQTMPPSSFLPGTAIEIRNPALRRGRIRFALFDFDGTLSLIREGWQQVMVPMMVEILRDTPHAEDAGQIELAVREFVATLTGKQTIYQMIQLCEEIEKRGGQPREPLWYKKLYLQRLWERIRSRIDALERGAADPDEMMVPGARALLEALRERGVRLFLASGTDLSDVKREAQLLRLSGYFEGGIYGALDDYKNFSKAMVVDRIVREHGLKGEEFVAFGDGYVEIENVKAVEGIAVGAATDEARRQGVDEWKRQRLIRAGADLIVPDFREWRALVAYLFDE